MLSAYFLSLPPISPIQFSAALVLLLLLLLPVLIGLWLNPFAAGLSAVRVFSLSLSVGPYCCQNDPSKTQVGYVISLAKIFSDFFTAEECSNPPAS